MGNFQEHLFWRISENSCFWKCVHENDKNKKLFVISINFTLKNSVFSISKCLFLFYDWFLSHEVSIYIQCFFGVVRNISFRTASTKFKLKLTKRRSKVQEKKLSCELALNFDQWKTLSENYKPMTSWLWLVHKFTENYCRLQLLSEFIQTKKRYPTSPD